MLKFRGLQERLAEAVAMRRIRQLNGTSKRAKVDERKVGHCRAAENLPRTPRQVFADHRTRSATSTAQTSHVCQASPGHTVAGS